MSVWAPGIRLGPYELTAPLGAGGMGEVWKARDTRVDRVVAIKRLKAEHAERFKREARAIAALNHPHICQLYDVGPDYLVMEYVEGEILTGPVPVADAVRLAVQIAEALTAAHRKGIVHRDLKPANILVAESGAKLLDFGLAQMDAPLMSGDGTISVALSEPGVIVGTVAYMSPEQAQGQAVDARSDVFSFGAVLYEVLSGRRAFRGGTPFATITAVINERPPALEAPAALGRIVSRCLAKQPGDRFQTMAEVRAALEQAAVSPAAQRSSIAVLPFANMSRDPGRRVLQRRTGRGDHQSPRARRRPEGHGPHLLVCLPRQGTGHPPHRGNTRRRERARRQCPPQSYERQRDRLREELTLAQIDHHAEATDELDVQGIMAFAERILPRASDLWVQASLDYKQRLQHLFFPEAIAFDGNRFNRTAITAPLFNYLGPSESADERVVSRVGIEPTTRRLRERVLAVRRCPERVFGSAFPLVAC